MSRIEFAPEVIDDLDRIFDHLNKHQVEHSAARIEDIVAAINVLERNPLIGRPAQANKRELIIGQRSRSYIALYQYIAEVDTVFVLAIRSQREAGYQTGADWPSVLSDSGTTGTRTAARAPRKT